MSAAPVQVNNFTTRYPGLANALFTEVKVAIAVTAGQPTPTLHTFRGLWDTGATNTVITQKVIDDLGLKPTGMVMASGVHGDQMTNTYVISLGLPNQVLIETLDVSVGILKGFDVLIGMDVINLGDMCVSNANGQTVLSFRMPSIATLDFVAATNQQKAAQTPYHGMSGAERNQPCPCGSGKKYKKCHGSNDPPIAV